jgi:hypothetical protein
VLNLGSDADPLLWTAQRAIPGNACGLFLGRIPAAWKTLLTKGLNLRACPHHFLLYLELKDSGVDLQVSLYPGAAQQEQILAEDLDKWCRNLPDDLRTKIPALGEEPEALLEELGQRLATMTWVANNDCVRGRVHLPVPTLFVLGRLYARACQTREDG